MVSRLFTARLLLIMGAISAAYLLVSFFFDWLQAGTGGPGVIV